MSAEKKLKQRCQFFNWTHWTLWVTYILCHKCYGSDITGFKR